MHDLFKSKRLEWPLLIESDRRGLYRLSISDRIEMPGKDTKKERNLALLKPRLD